MAEFVKGDVVVVPFPFLPYNFKLCNFNYKNKVESNPEVMLGKPVIKGTREFLWNQF